VLSPEEAVAAADAINAPVAIKIQSEDIPHKSDVGGVRLNVLGADDVRRSTQAVLENARAAHPNARIQGVLVQEMAPKGVEMILGMTWDEQFGPMIVLGAGGVMVEIFKDAAVKPAPLSPLEARAMLTELKTARLLDGFRGAPPADVDALINCCVRFSDFVMTTEGRFAAIDLNPVFVCAEGEGVRIADALIILRNQQKGNNNEEN
jgi:acetyltransferase